MENCSHTADEAAIALQCGCCNPKNLDVVAVLQLLIFFKNLDIYNLVKIIFMWLTPVDVLICISII